MRRGEDGGPAQKKRAQKAAAKVAADEAWDEPWGEVEVPVQKKRPPRKAAANAAADEAWDEPWCEVEVPVRKKRADKAAANAAADEVEVPVQKKRARGAAADAAADEAGDEPWDEAEQESSGRKAKAAKKPLISTPDQLEPGAVVLYGDGWRGVIHDAFEAIDGFWVADEDSGKVVRDKRGEIVTFKSAELRMVAPPPKVDGEKNPHAPAVAVFMLGTSEQMMKVLEHFGPPDPSKRTEPQELLAIPCSLCDPASLLRIAREGITPCTLKLAEAQRPDLHVGLRVYHLRHAIEQCAPLLRLESYFALAGAVVPFGASEIKESKDKEEKRWRKNMANQLDICVTAYGPQEPASGPPVEAAKQALGRSCGICLSDVLWEGAVQSGIRRALEVDDLPLNFVDGMGAHVFVILLPEDASITEEEGILSFHESMDADYASLGLPPEAAEKTEEAEEKVEEKLPPGWVRMQSRSTGKTYYYNKETHQSCFEFPQQPPASPRPPSSEPPLPPGWTKEVSKSTGKMYYFHAEKRKSTFVRPTE